MRGVGVPVHMLDTQYRMHREIAAFPSLTFYDGKLKTGVEDMDRIPPLGMPLNGQNLNFVNVEVFFYDAKCVSKVILYQPYFLGSRRVWTSIPSIF